MPKVGIEDNLILLFFNKEWEMMFRGIGGNNKDMLEWYSDVGHPGMTDNINCKSAYCDQHYRNPAVLSLNLSSIYMVCVTETQVKRVFFMF